MAVADPEKSEHRRKGAAGTLNNYIGTISNLFLYWEFFKKKYKISQEKGCPRSTRSTLIPPMYTDDSLIYIILNPVARREELLCWVVGWAGEQKHTCIACELPLVLFRVGSSYQAASRYKQGRLSKKKVGYSWFDICVSHIHIWICLTLGINPTCDWAWAFNSSAAWFWSTLTWTAIIQTWEKLDPVHKNQDPGIRIFLKPHTVEPRFNKGPRDWKNLFAIKRFRYIEVLFRIFYYY